LAGTLGGRAASDSLACQGWLGARTLIEGARLLPPASLLVFEVGQGVRLERTWRLRYRSRPLADHPHVLASALRRATARLSDGAGRLALPLSGGLDSPTLLAPTDRRPLLMITYRPPDSDHLLLPPPPPS